MSAFDYIVCCEKKMFLGVTVGVFTLTPWSWLRCGALLTEHLLVSEVLGSVPGHSEFVTEV